MRSAKIITINLRLSTFFPVTLSSKIIQIKLTQLTPVSKWQKPKSIQQTLTESRVVLLLVSHICIVT